MNSQPIGIMRVDIRSNIRSAGRCLRHPPVVVHRNVASIQIDVVDCDVRLGRLQRLERFYCLRGRFLLAIFVGPAMTSFLTLANDRFWWLIIQAASAVIPQLLRGIVWSTCLTFFNANK